MQCVQREKQCVQQERKTGKKQSKRTEEGKIMKT